MKCKYCGAEVYVNDVTCVVQDHDRSDGRVCRKTQKDQQPSTLEGWSDIIHEETTSWHKDSK